MRKQLVKDKIKLYKNESALTAKEILQNAEDSGKKMQELYENYCEQKKVHKQLKDNYKKLRECLDTEEYQIKQRRDTIQELQCELHKVKVK